MTVEPKIQAAVNKLDDAAAGHALRVVCRARFKDELGNGLIPSDGLSRDLRTRFKVPTDLEPVSEGDLAREALLLLAQDPSHREAIAALIHGPSPRSFDFGSTILIATGALIALQTRVRFERDKEGRWSFTLHKEPTKESLIRPLVSKLLAFLDR